MATQYRLIQYTPDPAAEERINIGVVAYEHPKVFLKLTKNWKRVERFCGPNPPNRDTLLWFLETRDEDRLKDYVIEGTSCSHICFSSLKTSVDDIDTTMIRAMERFVP